MKKQFFVLLLASILFLSGCNLKSVDSLPTSTPIQADQGQPVGITPSPTVTFVITETGEVIEDAAHAGVLGAVHEELDDVLPLGRPHEPVALELRVGILLEIVEPDRVAQHEEQQLAVEGGELARPARRRLRLHVRAGARGVLPFGFAGQAVGPRGEA